MPGSCALSEKRILFFTLLLSFAVSFILYIMTLAPTVTFEDSGELITAAYRLGIPHAPGYPLFTMLGRLFTLLPIGTIAYRVNLMSAFFSSFSVMILTWTMIHVIPMIFTPLEKDKNRSFYILLFVALFTGLMFAASFELWEQSVITEVYGLNAFFTSLLLGLAVLWFKTSHGSKREKIFYLMCYLTGLGLSNHYALILLIPAILVLMVSHERRYLLDLKRIAFGSVLFITGLLVYIYLPLASSRNPVMDWGNPETMHNFWLTITRHQYQVQETRSLLKLITQFSFYCKLILQQWWPVLLIPGIIGCIVLFMKNKSVGLFMILFLITTGPLTTYLTNFDISDPNPVVADENRTLITVFYIPSYMMITVLTGLGMFALLHWTRSRKYIQWTLYLMMAVILGWSVRLNYSQIDMSRYYFAEHYVQNLFTMTKPNGLVLTNYDPFYFTTTYYQYAEDQRNDLAIIDISLIKNSWYIDWLRKHKGTFIKPFENELKPYEAIIRSAERGEPYDSKDLSIRYNRLINTIIDSTFNRFTPVYLTFDPPEGIATEYYQISCVSVIELLKDTKKILSITIDQFHLDDYLDDGIPKDQMARFFKTYYGRLLYARGYILEALNRKTESKPFYLKSLEFMKQDKDLRPEIEKNLKRLDGK
jgi:hypothetical protein